MSEPPSVDTDQRALAESHERSGSGSAQDGARVAAVTGAAGAIGSAICHELGRRGYRVVAWGRSVSGLEGVRQVVEGEGGSLVTKSFDLMDKGACAEAVDWLARSYGRLDVLVNNAGAWFDEPIAESTDEHWRHVLEVNVVAPVRLARLALPLLRRSSAPRIVNIGSKNAFRGEAGLASYGVSKAALNALTREMAAEFATHGILVNCVAPGVIDTESNTDFLAEEGEVFLRRIPLGRFGTTEEVALAVAFVCSEECSFATGSTFLMDGGQLTGP
jgi:NAD(P)-dependent dehydrogenase (short-subunit alcohol dehydrogenase family)